jgi:hypothetical protein
MVTSRLRFSLHYYVITLLRYYVITLLRYYVITFFSAKLSDHHIERVAGRGSQKAGRGSRVTKLKCRLKTKVGDRRIEMVTGRGSRVASGGSRVAKLKWSPKDEDW